MFGNTFNFINAMGCVIVFMGVISYKVALQLSKIEAKATAQELAKNTTIPTNNIFSLHHNDDTSVFEMHNVNYEQEELDSKLVTGGQCTIEK